MALELSDGEEAVQFVGVRTLQVPIQRRRYRVLVCAAGTCCAVAFALSTALRPRQQALRAQASSEDAVGLSVGVSPFESVQQSFKPGIFTVDGAFTGGTCHLSNSSCPLANMPRGKLTGVFPGGETRCLLGDTPYVFQVIPGDADKLLLYFQGGGACWDGATASAKLCMREVADEGRVGIFDSTNEANPWRNYTIVILSYCSGDGHVGHATVNWQVTGSKGVAMHRGYVNAKSAIDWAKKNVGGGASKLASLIITGSSAGALGTQIWSRWLLQEFKYEQAAVLSDSYSAIFPVGVQGALMKAFGLCGTDLLTAGLHFLCVTGTIDVQMIWEEAMRSQPQVAFANLDSKIDFVQIAFYKVVYASRMHNFDTMSPQMFASHLSSVYLRYNMQPNWVSFAVNSAHHMYLNNPVLFQTTPVGTHVAHKGGSIGGLLALTGNQIRGSELPLVQWLANFPVKPAHSVGACCAGVTAAPPAPPSLPGFLGVVHTSLSTASHTLLSPVVNRVSSAAGFTGTCSPLVENKVFRAAR